MVGFLVTAHLSDRLLLVCFYNFPKNPTLQEQQQTTPQNSQEKGGFNCFFPKVQLWDMYYPQEPSLCTVVVIQNICTYLKYKYMFIIYFFIYIYILDPFFFYVDKYHKSYDFIYIVYI